MPSAALEGMRRRRSRLRAAPTLLHHIAYLQGHAVLIDLLAACPSLSKEERNSFLLNDLGISPADVTDVFMVPSTQRGTALPPLRNCRWGSPVLPLIPCLWVVAGGLFV
jgi:hypothetical protein